MEKTTKTPPTVHGNLRDQVRNPLSFFLSLTRQYGDVVCYRAAPEPAYLVNFPDGAKHILIDNNRNYSKATYINQMFKTVVADGLLTSEGEVWRKQRRLMQPAFHQQRIAGLGGLIVSATTALLERWQDQPVVNIASEMASLTLTITTKALFGIDIGEGVSTVGQAVTMAGDLLEKPRNARFQSALQSVEQVVAQIIDERRRAYQDTGDLLSMLLQARDEETGVGMDDRQLRDQVITLLLAGYETTASALTWTWVLLAQHPEWLQKLRTQVVNTIGDLPPGVQDLPNLPYTRMVFEEGLRIYPPAWILGRKALGEDEIGGFFVPANTIVAISPYTLHRRLDDWPDPEVFDPERFTPERSAGRRRFAYLPFGAGPRQCIGNNFAMTEAQIILAMIARLYSLELVPGQEIQPEPIFILRPNREINMSLQKA